MFASGTIPRVAGSGVFISTKLKFTVVGRIFWLLSVVKLIFIDSFIDSCVDWRLLSRVLLVVVLH